MAPLARLALQISALAVLATSLAGCSFLGINFGMAQMSEKECMMRAMYFESNRSSPEGMLAVGTVVMNRLNDPRYPKSVCSVVGQKNQFAQGVLTKPMTDSGAVLAARAVIEAADSGEVQRLWLDAKEAVLLEGTELPWADRAQLAVGGEVGLATALLGTGGVARVSACGPGARSAGRTARRPSRPPPCPPWSGVSRAGSAWCR